MNRRERQTLEGRPVDRPPVCFYELNGLDERPEDDDPFNIYTHPSWAPSDRTDARAHRPHRDARCAVPRRVGSGGCTLTQTETLVRER